MPFKLLNWKTFHEYESSKAATLCYRQRERVAERIGLDLIDNLRNADFCTNEGKPEEACYCILDFDEIPIKELNRQMYETTKFGAYKRRIAHGTISWDRTGPEVEGRPWLTTDVPVIDKERRSRGGLARAGTLKGETASN